MESTSDSGSEMKLHWQLMNSVAGESCPAFKHALENEGSE